MRFAALAAFLVAAAFAGCSGSPETTTSSSTTQTAVQPGWHLDCTLGAYEQAKAVWNQTCEARASHTAGSKQETWIAINPTNVANVVVGVKDLNPESSHACVWNGVFVTHDAGKTWKDVVIGGTYASRDPTSPFYGYACNTDPDFRFDESGDLHYGVEMYGLEVNGQAVPDPIGLAGGYKILLATSHDGGDTWPEVIVFQPDLVLVTDYSRMTIVPGTKTVLEAIGSEGGTGCNVLRWATGAAAATFEPVATPDGVPCNSGAGSGITSRPGLAVLLGDAGVVVRSNDDGLTWTDSNPLFDFQRIPGQFKESQYRTPGTVESIYDNTNGPNKGTLYACYPAADRAKDQADVYVRASKDDGRTWGPAVMVNQDEPGAHQWMCNIAVAGDGSVHVFFMDKQYDPDHKLIDLTHAWSMDGGRNWTTERVSTQSYDGDLGIHQEGFPFIGDYLGVDCVQSDCWAGFPDATLGGTVVAAAHVHLQ